MRKIQTTAWIFGTEAWFWVLTELVKVKPPCDGFLNERDNEQPVKRKVFSWIFFMLFFSLLENRLLKKLNVYWFFLRHMLWDGWLLDVIWGSKTSWNEKKNSNLMDSWWPLITFHSFRLVWNLWHCSLSVMCYTACFSHTVHKIQPKFFLQKVCFTRFFRLCMCQFAQVTR